MRVSRLLILLLMVVIVGGKRGGATRSRGTSRTRSPKTIKRVSKPGSVERTALFRSTILGAAAGYVTFKAGKNIINHADRPMTFGSRSYFWGTRYMPITDQTPMQCVHQIDPQDPQLGKIVFEDDTRPTEIVYACGEGEACCGFECCSENSFFKSLFFLLVIILFLAIFGVVLIELCQHLLNGCYNLRHKRSRDFQVLNM